MVEEWGNMLLQV